MTRTILYAALSLSLALAAAPTRADWPMQRHDARRTATSDGHSSIDRPALTFRTYLGGALGREQYLTADVDADTRPEVLFLMGGALVAKTPNDALVWETGALDLFRLDRLIDLDGDGTGELVASARAGKVYVLRVSDGQVLWELPTGVVGNVGAVRFADFDLDGASDLYLADSGCGSTGSLGDVARVYRFAAGFTEPALHFELERGARDYVCGNNDTLVDLDGDARPEVVAQGRYHFYVYSGADGSLLSTSANIGSIPYGQATTRLADVDADGTPELVCFTDNGYAPPVNSRRVFLMAWNATAGVLEKRWERGAADLLIDRHGWSPGGVEDLGADGRVEVVTSFYQGASDTWTTLVLDAATGAELASIARGPFRGLADVDADGSSEVLVAPLGALHFTGAALEQVFLAPDMRPVYVRDHEAQRSASADLRALTVDLDGDGAAALIALQTTGGATSLVALDASTDPPTVTARLPIEDEVSLSTFEVFPAVTRPTAQILTARSDGYLWVLDEALQPTNAETEGGEFPERGLRIGGYYSGSNGIGPAPIAVDLDGDGAAEVIARDSRGVLRRIDARGASLVTPPATVWEQRSAGLPTASDVDGDGTPEIVVGVGGQIRALRGSDGTTVWSTVVGSSTAAISHDLVPAELSGDTTPDIAYQLRDSAGGTVRINVLDGTDGSRRWDTDYTTVVAGSGLGALAVGPRAGADAILAAPRNLLMWLDPASGASLGSVAAGYPAAPVFADVDGAAGDELLTSGGVQGLYAMRPDLTTLWASTGTFHTRVLGAAVSCPDGVRFVQGHNNNARFTAWNAADGAVLADVALRDGRVFDPPESAPDGPGVLGNVTVAPDLTGAGEPRVLVPSTDGHLYALDPCTFELDFALDFRRPVGEAILADTDGDGEEEIIVTVADGYLYGVSRERIAAPSWVHENGGGGPALTPEDDVDELITRDRLWANWAAVDEATSYEVAVITPGGAFLTSPPFVDVGDVTEVVLDLLPLRAGRRYLVAVRAIGPEGASSETLSDGVTVLADPCDACGPTQRCVDHACEADPCFGVECGFGLACVEGVCTGHAPDGGTQPMADGGVEPPPPASGGCCTVAPGGARGGFAGMLVASLMLGLLLARRR